MFGKFKKRKPEFTSSEKYWKNRYENNGNSGAGSYNDLAKFKAHVLNDFVEKNDIQKVVEFGSGDGNQLQYFNFKNYTGYDVSEKAVSLCRALYAEDKTKAFYALPQDKLEKGQLVLSLDVIYHLVEDDVFNSYMETLFSSSTDFVIIYASNDSEIESNDPHVRHRVFTEWVAENVQGFELLEHIPNAYPYDKRKPRKTSFADFYIYRRVD